MAQLPFTCHEDVVDLLVSFLQDRAVARALARKYAGPKEAVLFALVRGIDSIAAVPLGRKNVFSDLERHDVGGVRKGVSCGVAVCEVCGKSDPETIRPQLPAVLGEPRRIYDADDLDAIYDALMTPVRYCNAMCITFKWKFTHAGVRSLPKRPDVCIRLVAEASLVREVYVCTCCEPAAWSRRGEGLLVRPWCCRDARENKTYFMNVFN